MNLLAIDPGNTSGFAYFVSGQLVWALEAPPDHDVPCLLGSLVVIECPVRIFKQATVNSILHLSRCVGRYQERYRENKQKLVAPHEWKGTIDGDIMTNRIEAQLTPAERALLPTKPRGGLDHNMLDAIGLGKWSLRQPWAKR
jgi:hypothetical protein